MTDPPAPIEVGETVSLIIKPFIHTTLPYLEVLVLSQPWSPLVEEGNPDVGRHVARHTSRLTRSHTTCKLKQPPPQLLLGSTRAAGFAMPLL